jgi:hypothetical protein
LRTTVVSPTRDPVSNAEQSLYAVVCVWRMFMEYGPKGASTAEP